MVRALRLSAERDQPLRGWSRSTRRSVRGIFRHVQEVNCPKGARETTLGCAAAKNDLASFRRERRKPGRGPLPGLSPGDEGRKSPVNCLLLSGCLRSGSPRSGLAGERAAAAARRKPPVGCLLLPVPPAIRLAAERLRRRGGRFGGGTRDGCGRFAARRGRGDGKTLGRGLCCVPDGRITVPGGRGGRGRRRGSRRPRGSPAGATGRSPPGGRGGRRSPGTPARPPAPGSGRGWG